MSRTRVCILGALALLALPGSAVAQVSEFTNVKGGSISQSPLDANGRGFNNLNIIVAHPATQFSADAIIDEGNSGVSVTLDGWRCFNGPVQGAAIKESLSRKIGRVDQAVVAADDPVKKTQLLRTGAAFQDNILNELTDEIERTAFRNKTNVSPEALPFSLTLPNCYSTDAFNTLLDQMGALVKFEVDTRLEPIRDELGDNPLEQGSRERIQ